MRMAAAALLAPALGRAALAQLKPGRLIDVVIRGRRVVSPAGAIRLTRGEVVELRVRSDERAELHLHGYDRELRVVPGKTASMVLFAHATGRFALTSHGWRAGGHRHDALTYIEVYPR